MAKANELSRRERQIMEIVFAKGEATVKAVQAELTNPPTDMAIRRTMHILVEKGVIKGRKQGREVVYSPRQSRVKAGLSELQSVLETFFSGSMDQALAARLSGKEALSNEELDRMQKLIEQARREGR